jgi:hypothetical protein
MNRSGNQRESNDLLKTIIATLDDGVEFWFEGLASRLSRRRWKFLSASIALNLESYGTARCLTGDPISVRDELCHIQLPEEFGCSHQIIVEALPPEIVAKYAKIGLEFYAPASIPETLIKSRFIDAFKLISAVPGIASAVAELLAVAHVLKPLAPEYDISYSDPSVPFSIFVSICPHAQEHDDLRLAEAIVHECMHLQLTLLEDVVPLVKDGGDKFYSPWQGTMRPSQGILHGLYVFRVIDEFFAALLQHGQFGIRERRYMSHRIATIKREIAGLMSFEHSEDLTTSGRRIVQSLLRNNRVAI